MVITSSKLIAFRAFSSSLVKMESLLKLLSALPFNTDATSISKDVKGWKKKIVSWLLTFKNKYSNVQKFLMTRNTYSNFFGKFSHIL